jgi:translation elongation factor EF-Tu-like GTPase
MSNKPPDIEAEIYFLTTAEGGRNGPVRSGYRPQFFYNDHHWDAHQEYPEREWVQLGETARTLLWFMSPQCHWGKVSPGMEFEIMEGPRVVGRGTVTAILNLEQSAKELGKAS